MFADAIAALAASIFPIFYAYENADGPIISVSGTGFFVDDNGLFVTGDHIMNCAPAGAEYYYFGNLPDELIQPPLKIERVASEHGQVRLPAHLKPGSTSGRTIGSGSSWPNQK